MAQIAPVMRLLVCGFIIIAVPERPLALLLKLGPEGNVPAHERMALCGRSVPAVSGPRHRVPEDIPSPLVRSIQLMGSKGLPIPSPGWEASDSAISSVAPSAAGVRLK
jgi:hypothetical protein